MFMSHHQTAGQNLYVKVANKSIQNVAVTETNQHCIHEKIKSILNSGNACYHTVQNLMSSLFYLKAFWLRIGTGGMLL
jgi:hypothetical protein